MEEEKSLIEYKEQKGLLGWLKSRIEKIKEKFKPKQENKKERPEEPGFTEQEMDVVEGGYQNPQALDMDERKAKIDAMNERKTWEITEEVKKEVEKGYEEIREASKQQEEELEPDQLTEDELEQVMYMPTGIAPRQDYPNKSKNSNDVINFGDR